MVNTIAQIFSFFNPFSSIFTLLFYLILIFNLFSFSIVHVLFVSLAPLPFQIFLCTSHPRFEKVAEGRGLALGCCRCGKTILICAHSDQCHSAQLVSLYEHQNILSGTAVTNSNRYHFKIISPPYCVWLKPIVGARVDHGWMGPLQMLHTEAPVLG